MIVGLLLFLPAILIGWSAVRILRAVPREALWTGALIEISLGAGVGIGVVSIAYFGLLWANVAGRAVLLSAEVAMAAGGVWLAIRRRAVKSEAAPVARSPWIWLLRAAAILTLLFFAFDASKSMDANPHGGWDAFTIWNLKAKFLAGGSGSWRNAMAPVAGGALFGANHPGYPLLLPAAVASAWTMQGATASATPAALSALFAFATAAMLCAAIAWLRGEAAGLIALLLLLGTEGFVSQAGLQNADVPISFYLLAVLMLLVFASDQGWPRGTMALAGLCCAFAAWTKNEGLPFAILAVAVVAWRGGRKATRWMAVGALPVAALIAGFKFLLVPDREAMFPRTMGEALSKAADWSRWMQIAESFIQSLWQMGSPWVHPVLLVAILAVTLGLEPRSRVRQRIWLAVPIAGLLPADFAAYLVTTADLGWQLSTSNVRLLVQVWPSLLFLTLLVIVPPALEQAAALEMQKPAHGKAKRKQSRGSVVQAK